MLYHHLQINKSLRHSIWWDGVILFFLLFNPLFITAQVSAGGIPISWQLSDSQSLATSIPEFKLPVFDLKEIKIQDQQQQRSVRFAAPISTDINLNKDGKWTILDNGNRLWQIQITSTNALALAFQYDEFYLPAGAKFYMYSADHQQLLGAYTSANNKQSGKMLTGLIQGETAILEYLEPAAVLNQGQLHVFQIQHAYDSEILRDSGYEFQVYAGGDADFGYCASLDCEVNVNCAEGADIQNEKRGVVRILMVAEEGMNFCSGTLLNNTRQDGTPYVLSAYHCMEGFTPQYDFWRFDFNYENSHCNETPQEPDYQSIVGCIKRSSSPDSDFILVEINQAIPTSFNAYYNGWDRTSHLPATSTLIHHPAGDVKKISQDNDPTEVYQRSISWSNNVETPAQYHFRTVFDRGTFEVGSSGGTLLNPEGLVVGQLHGGNASCTRFIAFFGRFYYSWDSGNNRTQRLKDWLDPLNLGIPQLAGMDAQSQAFSFLTGSVLTEKNQGISDVQVVLKGTLNFSTTTDENGRFFIQNVPKNQNYVLELYKDGDDLNGVTTYDLIKIRQHILRTNQLKPPFRFLAADVNNSQEVTTFDVVKLRKMVLGLDQAFTNNQSWRFIPKTFNYSNPTEYPFEYSFEPIRIENLQIDLNLNFLGIKVGDLNFSAEP